MPDLRRPPHRGRVMTPCAVCAMAVDQVRGTRFRSAGAWAHQTCIRMWAAALDGDELAQAALWPKPAAT